MAARNRVRACIEGLHAPVWMSRRLMSVEGEGVVTATQPPATFSRSTLISVTRPCSTTTCTPPPMTNPCSSSHRPDILR